jgi:hypothetical protein
MMNRRNFLVSFLLWILSFFFGYRIGSADTPVVTDPSKILDEEGVSVSDKLTALNKKVDTSVGDLTHFRDWEDNVIEKMKSEFQDRHINLTWFFNYVPNKGASREEWDWGEALQAALDTGLNVYVPRGTWRIHEKEILIVTQGQKLFGAGMGSSHGPDSLRNHQTVTDLVFTGKGKRYVKTRRKPRIRASDPQDKPLSTAINVQNDGVEIEDLCIRLHCNYKDERPSNLGDDWDVGLFIGGREQFRATNVRIMGYWRVASHYYDATGAPNLPPFSTPVGRKYPEGHGRSAIDQSYLTNIYARGGWKGLFVAGPLETSTGQYYDQISGQIVEDLRGRAGAGDFHSLNCTYWNAEHHSGHRFLDPIQPLNFESENLDEIPAAVCIDGRGYGVERRLLRRMMFTNLRVRNTEAYRIVLGRVQELYFFSLHTELGDELVVKDTKGQIIDFDNEDPDNGKNYGPIAVKQPIVSTKYGVYIYGINFRTPVPRWFQEVIPYEMIGQAHEPKAELNNLQVKKLAVGAASTTTLNVTNAIRSENFLFSGMHRPITDNEHNLGSAASRWRTLFSVDGTINQSDRDTKEQIGKIPDKVLDAWSEVDFCQFKFKDAVEKKGPDARWHIGLIAQDIYAAFKKHGLNAFDYGLLCYDEWEEEYEEVTADQNEPTEEKIITQKAGSRWSVRFDECQFLEMALMRRELQRLRSR